MRNYTYRQYTDINVDYYMVSAEDGLGFFVCKLGGPLLYLPKYRTYQRFAEQRTVESILKTLRKKYVPRVLLHFICFSEKIRTEDS